MGVPPVPGRRLLFGHGRRGPHTIAVAIPVNNVLHVAMALSNIVESSDQWVSLPEGNILPRVLGGFEDDPHRSWHWQYPSGSHILGAEKPMRGSYKFLLENGGEEIVVMLFTWSLALFGWLAARHHHGGRRRDDG